MSTWRRERGEGLGSHWSYAVLCDKVAQVFLSMNFNRGKRWVSPLMLSPVLLSIFTSPPLLVFNRLWTAADNKTYPSYPVTLLLAQYTDCSSPPSPAETLDGQIRDCFSLEETQKHTAPDPGPAWIMVHLCPTMPFFYFPTIIPVEAPQQPRLNLERIITFAFTRRLWYAVTLLALLSCKPEGLNCKWPYSYVAGGHFGSLEQSRWEVYVEVGTKQVKQTRWNKNTYADDTQ